jgi:hypothetical protein
VTTAADLIATTQKRYLRGGAQPQKNKLAANYTAGSSSLTFTYDLRGIQAGATLSIGLNVFYVWSVDTTTKTAVVDGGQDGSTDANALAGATVYVNAGYSDFEVFTALNEDIASLSAPSNGLFKVGTVQFTFSSASVGYDLAGVTDLQQILEVRYAEPDSYGRTPRLDTKDYRLERNTTVGEYSSTFSLKLLRGGYPGRTVTVLYRTGFTQLAATTDNLTVTGLPTTAYDLPPMGAALRLLVGREIRRNDITSQGDTRRAEEVGPGAEAASWRGLAGMRAQRINEEVSKLQAQYPARTF